MSSKITKKSAFTLVELLVVIAVIALLMAVLMPALNKAKEQGQRMVCMNHEKQLALANDIYANECDEWFVPVIDGSVPDTTPPGGIVGYPFAWVANKKFKKIIGTTDKVSFDPRIDTVMPDEYLCPSDKLAVQHRVSMYRTLASYGYNFSDWYGNPGGPPVYWNPPWTTYYAGHKRSKIRYPAKKLVFIDSNDWLVTWRAANYRRAWDIYGQAPSEVYGFSTNFTLGGAPVLYRHSEGACIGFYDGHVQWLPKEHVFISVRSQAKPDGTDMWFVIKYQN